MRQIESIFWGIVAALGALVAQIILFSAISIVKNPVAELSLANFFTIPSFIAAGAVIEEIFKYVMVNRRVDLISLQKSYIMNSLLVGLGFFLVEFSLIATNSVLPTSRAILEIAFLHMGTAGIMGYTVALRNPRKISTLIFSIVPAAFFHVSYNLLAIKRSPMEDFAIFLLLGLLVIVNVINVFRISRKLA
ncbi:MAG TPA: PrsW family glutamic-type intramembrane protease [Patescibacteria group bacterium]